MKTHITRHLLALLAGTALACAAEDYRAIPSDPGSGSGNTGAADAGTSGQTMNPPAEQTPTRREYRDPNGNTLYTTGTLAGPDGAATLKRGDQRFFEKITRLNEREVALSRQAVQRATNPQVRSFAEEMVREHTRSGQELGSLANRKGARLATVVAREGRKSERIEKDWAEKKGADYDKAYVKEMIDAHEDTLDILENGADSKDPEIAATAQKMLPKVKAQLEQAESLHKQLD